MNLFLLGSILFWLGSAIKLNTIIIIIFSDILYMDFCTFPDFFKFSDINDNSDFAYTYNF